MWRREGATHSLPEPVEQGAGAGLRAGGGPPRMVTIMGLQGIQNPPSPGPVLSGDQSRQALRPSERWLPVDKGLR